MDMNEEGYERVTRAFILAETPVMLQNIGFRADAESVIHQYSYFVSGKTLCKLDVA